jgi:MurNAc alpha-1-phosphate uridylyltransferase
MKLPTKAMILAAGLGKRMRPLTNSIPKPMIEVGGTPMIDRMLDLLEASGISEVVVNISYLADVLEAHLKTRAKPNLIFSREESPLETGGGVKKVLSFFGNSPFFVTNGDIVCVNGSRPFLQRLADAWEDNLDALLLVHSVEKAIGYDGAGDFNVDTDGNLSRAAGEKTYPYVFTGIQILHPRIFAHSPDGTFSLNILYGRSMSENPPRIKAVIHDGDWLHIGDPKGKMDADGYLAKFQ